MKNLICSVDWMENYHEGKTKHLEEGKGHECFNFKPLDGKIFGYVRATAGTIRIDRLGARKDDDFIDDVRIIFIAKNNADISLVVGFYRKARVWRYKQPGHHYVPGKPKTKISYHFEADEDDAICIQEENRTFKVPRSNPETNSKENYPGQSRVFFIDEYVEMKEWKKEFEKYLKNFDEQPATDNKKENKSSGYGANAEKNKQVEVAAIDAVIAYLGPDPRDRQRDNCGWDLEFEKDGKKLCVEVKGRSGPAINADVSPNEYQTMQHVMNGQFTDGEYRLAIVTEALDEENRQVHLFGYTKDKEWVCEKGNRIIATERVAAVFNLVD